MSSNRTSRRIFGKDQELAFRIISRDIECFSWIAENVRENERDYGINTTRVTVDMFLQSRMWRMHPRTLCIFYIRIRRDNAIEKE